MLLFSMLFSLAQASPTPEASTRIVFAGQPTCVSLTWEQDEARTLLENHCDEAVLVDHAVKPDGLPVLPGAKAYIADMNKFTLGVGGHLYQALALVREVPAVQPDGRQIAEDS